VLNNLSGVFIPRSCELQFPVPSKEPDFVFKERWSQADWSAQEVISIFWSRQKYCHIR
jgi:hypothetical protein